MASGGSTTRARVVYDGDEPDAEVVIGQRELAAWERAPEWAEGRKLTGFRYAAWWALKRAGRLKCDEKGRALAFRVWDDTVIEVEPVDDEDEAGRPTGEGQPRQG